MSVSSFSMSMLALGIVVGGSAMAAEAVKPTTHEGKLVNITSSELVMTDSGGTKHVHKLVSNVELTLDGAACKAVDLKPGTKIRVATRENGPDNMAEIEAIDRNAAFAKNSHEGKVVSVGGNELVMTSQDGKKHSHKLPSETQVTLDGRTCQPEDLKPGTRIRVTIWKDQDRSGIQIDGIDQQAKFDSRSREGKVVRVRGDEVVIATENGEEFSEKVAADVKLTLDGKVSKAVDLKPGTRIRVTDRTSEASDVIRVEGLEKNPRFATR